MKFDSVKQCIFMVISCIKWTHCMGSTINIQSQPEVIVLLIDNQKFKIAHFSQNNLGNLTFKNYANVSNASDVAFNCHDNTFMYTDPLNKKIMSLDYSTGNKRPVIQEELEDPCAIVVDPSNEVFYFIDCKRLVMEMANLNGSDRKSIAKFNQSSEPKDLALDPKKGFLFVGDAGLHVIERFDINDKLRRTVIIEDVVWPNGLTTDPQHERLYFVDGKLKRNWVKSATYEGKDQKLIFNGTEQIKLNHVCAIIYYQGILYITDMAQRFIMAVETSGNNSVVIAINLEIPTSLVMISASSNDLVVESDTDNTLVIVLPVVISIILVVIILVSVFRRCISDSRNDINCATNTPFLSQTQTK